MGHVEDERLLFDPKCKSLNTQTVCLIGRHSSVSTPIIRNDLGTPQEVAHASDFGYLKDSTTTIPSFFKKMLCNSQENSLPSEVIFHPTPCVPAPNAFPSWNPSFSHMLDTHRWITCKILTGKNIYGILTKNTS